MTEIRTTKTRFDLEDRTFTFAKNVAVFGRGLPRTVSNIEYQKQVVRSTGSVGANYIEANEALSKKDFLLRLKICRKEAKESVYWLRLLISTNDSSHERQGINLVGEAIELKKIFSAIIENSKSQIPSTK